MGIRVSALEWDEANQKASAAVSGGVAEWVAVRRSRSVKRSALVSSEVAEWLVPT